MQIRVAAFIFVLAALAGFFGVRRALDDTPAPSPSSTGSRQSSVAAQLQILEQTVRDRPDDAGALTRIATAYLQRARETGDSAFYALAESAVGRAAAIAPGDVQSMIIAGSLALARHDFDEALWIGEQALAGHPDVNATYAIVTDALIELGRYDEAAISAQQMVDRRPDFASLTRASYLRELYGDLAGAIELMEQSATSAGADFDRAWALVIAGNLRLQLGDVVGADDAYARANDALPGDAMVQAALARIAIARGGLAAAEMLLRSAVEQRPLPEYAAALGDLLSSQGRELEAEEQYALVRATQQLLSEAGVDTDVELALFEADHGTDPQRTYQQALDAYTRRPTIFAADTVAWAAFKIGLIADARRFSAESLRLGTRDPRLLYHAGVIVQAAGDVTAAESYLREAVAMEPAQSPVYAAGARAILDALTAEAAR
jgi:tetratricopeptide (TPR) repeat protein